LRKKHKSAINALVLPPDPPYIIFPTIVSTQFEKEKVALPLTDQSFAQCDSGYLEMNSSNLQTPLSITQYFQANNILGASHLLPPSLTPIHYVPVSSSEKLLLLTKQLPLESSLPEQTPIPSADTVSQMREENFNLKNQLLETKLQLAGTHAKL
jgi:hypothetical protein